MSVLLIGTLAACGHAQVEPAELCEVLAADKHRPGPMFFHQEVSDTGSRRFRCSYIGEATESTEQLLEILEPFCREFIGKALSASRKCKATAFSDSATSVELFLADSLLTLESRTVVLVAEISEVASLR